MPSKEIQTVRPVDLNALEALLAVDSEWRTADGERRMVPVEDLAALVAEVRRARRFKGWRVKSSTGFCAGVETLLFARRRLRELHAYGWKDLRIVRVYRKAKP